MRESAARSDEKLPAREVDRRQWVRYPVRLAATCRAGGSADEPVWSAQVQDISHGGLRPIEECAFGGRDKDVAGIQIQVIDGLRDSDRCHLHERLDDLLPGNLDFYAG